MTYYIAQHVTDLLVPILQAFDPAGTRSPDSEIQFRKISIVNIFLLLSSPMFDCLFMDTSIFIKEITVKYYPCI